MLVMPLQHAADRRAEASADVAALDLTGDPVTCRANLVLARSNLADPDPPAWMRLRGWLTLRRWPVRRWRWGSSGRSSRRQMRAGSTLNGYMPG